MTASGIASHDSHRHSSCHFSKQVTKYTRGLKKSLHARASKKINAIQHSSNTDRTKLRRVTSCICGSSYGAVRCDPTNASVRDVCVVWRKGLRAAVLRSSHTVICFHCCVMCCHLWTSWVVDAQNLLRTHFIVTVMLSVVLQDTAFTTVGCCRRLAEMHISAARDVVSRYITLHLLPQILFIAMFNVLISWCYSYCALFTWAALCLWAELC